MLELKHGEPEPRKLLTDTDVKDLALARNAPCTERAWYASSVASGAVSTLICAMVIGPTPGYFASVYPEPRQSSIGISLNTAKSTVERRPCQDAFRELASSAPKCLLEWIYSGELQPHFLTFALEELGASGKPEFIGDLIAFAANRNPLVREGAIYGLAHFLGDARACNALYFRAEHDEHSAVREAASTVLS